jgi:BRCT domain type II-containing protein
LVAAVQSHKTSIGVMGDSAGRAVVDRVRVLKSI